MTPETCRPRSRKPGAHPRRRPRRILHLARRRERSCLRSPGVSAAAADEIDTHFFDVRSGWNRGDGFVASVRLALKAVLVSPHFLFLAEPEPEEAGSGRSTRCRRWRASCRASSGPRARRGTSCFGRTRAALGNQCLPAANPKDAGRSQSGALGERFALQWLDLDRLGSDVRPDPKNSRSSTLS